MLFYFLNILIFGLSLISHLPSFDQSSNLDLIILGMDRRDDRLEKNTSTDTIIYTHYDYSSNQASLFSLPRDIWYDPLSTKINQFYTLDTSGDFSQLQKNYSSLVGQPINRTLVIETSTIQDIIGVIGYLDVYNPQAFTDYSYPNPEYINDPSKPIYITVSYPQGWQRLNQDTIIPFIRSRKSDVAGTDIGRIGRQQLIVDSLLKIPQSSRLIDLAIKFPELINIYNRLETNLNTKDLSHLIFNLYQQRSIPTLTTYTIPVGLGKSDGLIYHPTTFKNAQWVFLPSTPDFSSIQNYIRQQISTLALN